MKEIVLSEQDIEAICKRIGKQLSDKFRDNVKPPVMICVLKGATPFFADLIQEMDIPIVIDFIQISSFLGTESTGSVALKRDVMTNLKDRDIVVVDDVLDTAISMKFLLEFFKKKYNPSSITTVALLDKRAYRKVEFEGDIIGKTIQDGFLVGYGLDYYEMFRNCKYVFIPDEKELADCDEYLKKAGLL